MEEFTRGIEHFMMMWHASMKKANVDHIYEKSRDQLIDQYLKRILDEQQQDPKDLER